jgi:hypothetical protein
VNNTVAVNAGGTLAPGMGGVGVLRLSTTAVGSTISGTFAGFAEGAVFPAANNPSVLFAISYVGGDGNDVVLCRGNRRGTLVLVL